MIESGAAKAPQHKCNDLAQYNPSQGHNIQRKLKASKFKPK
jgi:hypothetical protein